MFNLDYLIDLIGYKSRGLNDLCQKILFFPLNKSEQTSNWEDRPLSQFQVKYNLE